MSDGLMQEVTHRPHARWRRVLAWSWRKHVSILAGLLACWWLWAALWLSAWDWPLLLLLAVFPLVLFSAVATAVVGRRRPLLTTAVLVCSPVVGLPLNEVVKVVRNYFDGSGYLMRRGTPSWITSSDPITRIPVHRSGCVVTLLWNARARINNEMLMLITSNLGPMEGLYLGPLPTGSQLESHVRDRGRELRAAYDGTSIRLQSGEFSPPFPIRYVLDRALEAQANDTPPRNELRVTVMHDDLFVLYESQTRPDGERAVTHDYVVFVLSTGKYLNGTVDWGLAVEYPEFAPRWQREAAIAYPR